MGLVVLAGAGVVAPPARACSCGDANAAGTISPRPDETSVPLDAAVLVLGTDGGALAAHDRVNGHVDALVLHALDADGTGATDIALAREETVSAVFGWSLLILRPARALDAETTYAVVDGSQDDPIALTAFTTGTAPAGDDVPALVLDEVASRHDDYGEVGCGKRYQATATLMFVDEPRHRFVSAARDDDGALEVRAISAIGPSHGRVLRLNNDANECGDGPWPEAGPDEMTADWRFTAVDVTGALTEPIAAPIVLPPPVPASGLGCAAKIATSTPMWPATVALGVVLVLIGTRRRRR